MIMASHPDTVTEEVRNMAQLFCPKCGAELNGNRCPNCAPVRKNFDDMTPEEKKASLRADLAAGRLEKWQYNVEMSKIRGDSDAGTTHVSRGSVAYVGGRYTVKRQGFLLAAAIISTVLSVFLIVMPIVLGAVVEARVGDYIKDALESGEITQQQADELRDEASSPMQWYFSLVSPVSLLPCVAGSVFAWIGWGARKRWAALVAGVAFVCGGLAMLTLVCAVFSFISYARMTQ